MKVVPSDPSSSQAAYDKWSAEIVRDIGTASAPLSHRMVVLKGQGTKDQSPAPAEIVQSCHEMAWASTDIPLASSLVVGQKTDIGPWPWSSGMACACLGRCSYDAVDGLAVEEACPSALSMLAGQLAEIQEPDARIRGFSE